MWYKRDVNRLITDNKHDEVVAKLCKTFKISMSHAEEIIREIGQYQWHVRRFPKIDVKVKEILAEHKGREKLSDRPKGFVPAVKMIREMTTWGLLEAKTYLEDITLGMKPWPEPVEEDESFAQMILEVK